jgi:hypothetical protein
VPVNDVNKVFLQAICELHQWHGQIGCGHPHVLETSVYLYVPISKGLYAINIDTPHTLTVIWACEDWCHPLPDTIHTKSSKQWFSTTKLSLMKCNILS